MYILWWWMEAGAEDIEDGMNAAAGQVMVWPPSRHWAGSWAVNALDRPVTCTMPCRSRISVRR